MAEILQLMESDPHQAKEMVDSTIARLQSLSLELQRVIETKTKEHSPASMTDIVRIQVIGPDGSVKQSVNVENDNGSKP